VNLHTVRQAYLALEADGFVATAERQSARVAQPATDGLQDEINQFLDWVTTTAADRFALRPADVAARLLARPTSQTVHPREKIWFLECSSWLTSTLAKQLSVALSRNVRPWPVARAKELPPGRCISTYYHLSEVRRALAGRPESPKFVTVHLEKNNLARLQAALDPADPRLIICGVDCATAQAIAVDLDALGIKADFDVRVANDPSQLLAEFPTGTPILMSPQQWDRLSAKERTRPGVFPLALYIDEKDLDHLAYEWGIREGQRKDGKRRPPRKRR
jgi:hypothetical protein